MENNPFARFAAPNAAENDNTRGTVNAPENTPTPAAKAKPADTLTGWGTRRRKLTDAEVEQLRKAYKFRRDLAESAESADDWETVNDTLKGVAAESGGLVTASALNRLVLGESYANAPGPLDSARIARRARNKELANRLGPEAGRSMARSACKDVTPSYVVIEVTRPDGATKQYTYPAGTVVTLRTGEGTTAPKPDKGGDKE
jgi:hypothetical protein